MDYQRYSILYPMNIIDTHCHLDFKIFDADREAVIRRARRDGVSGFVIPGVEWRTWDVLLEICQSSSDLHCALGLHPMFLQQHENWHVNELESYISEHKPVAVGEIGLDFYDRKHTDRQIELFEMQLGVAQDVQLPVILHVRKAHEEVLACLKKFRIKAGIVHAFNGSVQQAERYLQYNFKFGFGGMLTYQRSTKLRKLASELSLESIVLETDSPDMAVEQHRGERNSPEYLPYCLKALAEIRNISLERVAELTTSNAQEVLELD
ncbi:MAG: TatD family hydrolase [Pseudomonadota bacterium]